MLDHTFDIITISESKLKKDPVINIEIPGYKTPSITKTEGEKGGTLIYTVHPRLSGPRLSEPSIIRTVNPKIKIHF